MPLVSAEKIIAGSIKRTNKDISIQLGLQAGLQGHG
jgi:hypothetical protein